MRSEQTSNDWESLGDLSTQTRGYVKHIPRVELLERLIDAEDGNFQAAFVRWMEIVGEEAETLAKYPVDALEDARGKYLLADQARGKVLQDIHWAQSQRKEAAEVLLPHLGIEGTANYVDVPVWRFVYDVFKSQNSTRWESYLEAEALLKGRKYTFAEVGRRVGFAKATVSRLAKLLGLASARTSKYPEETVREAREMWATGQYTQRELCDKFGIYPSTLNTWCHGVKSPRSKVNGQRTHPKKAEAIRLFEEGMSHKEVAATVGVVKRTVERWTTELKCRNY